MNSKLNKRPYIQRIVYGVLLMGILLSGQTAHAFDQQFYSSNDILFYNPDSQTCTAAQDSTSSSAASSQSLTVKKDFTLGTEANKRAVNLATNIMQDYNLKDFQAAGIVGNFMVESGGNHVPPDVNEGGSAGPPAFSGGYGWAQWTGGRQVTFINYAVNKGYMGSKAEHATDAANYAYLNEELVRSGEGKVMPAIKATSSLSDAVVAWEKTYERADPNKANNPERIRRGNMVLTALKGDGTIKEAPSGSTGTSDASATGSDATLCESDNTAVQTASATFDNVAFPLIGSKKVVKNPEIFKDGTTSRGGHPYIAYDIYANAGSKVVAFASGTVKQISSDKCGSRLVGIYNEKADVILSYMHLNPDDNVPSGTKVQPGDPVGTVASVKRYPCVNVDHLHIDAEAGDVRDACAREACASSVMAKFRDIGPDLFNAYQKLPD